MSITALPTPPTRSDPVNFAERADSFLGALPTFATEANALQTDVNTKQSTASTAATTATTQAGIATTQADIATTQASNASTSATLASNWVTKTTGPVDGSEYSAKYYANQASLAMDSFQGALSSDPALDKFGGALAAGDWYVNTVSGFLRVYNGSAWVQGVSAVSGVSSINGETGDVTGFLKSSDIGSTVQPYDADLDSWAAISPTSKVSATSGTASGLTLNDGYTEEVFAVSGATPALSPTNGSIQTWTLSGNSTPTAGTWAAGQSVTLMIDDGTEYTITWTSLAVTWKTNAGSAPTLNTSGFTAIQLWKVGTTIYGARVGDA